MLFGSPLGIPSTTTLNVALRCICGFCGNTVLLRLLLLFYASNLTGFHREPTVPSNLSAIAWLYQEFPCLIRAVFWIVFHQGVSAASSARNFVEPMKWSTGVARVPIIRVPRSRFDHNSIPVPNEKNSNQPARRKPHGLKRRANSAERARTNSLEYSAVSSPSANISFSVAQRTQTW